MSLLIQNGLAYPVPAHYTAFDVIVKGLEDALKRAKRRDPKYRRGKAGRI